METFLLVMKAYNYTSGGDDLAALMDFTVTIQAGACKQPND